MIHHWKGVDLEITLFKYYHDPTSSGEIIPSRTSRFVIPGYYFIMRDGVEYPERRESKKAKLLRAEQ